MTAVRTTHEILATGILSGWAGIGLLLLIGVWVCFHLNREFVDSREVSTVRLLYGLRILIVCIGIWLLCQPMLVTRTDWQEKPRALILESSRSTMATREDFGALYRKLDALSALGQSEVEERNQAASKLQRRLESLGEVLERGRKRFSTDLFNLTSGLPPAAQFEEAVEEFAQQARQERAEIASVRNLLPDGAANKELQESLAQFSTELSLVLSECEKLDQELHLAAQEAFDHPELLEKFITHLAGVHIRSGELAKVSGEVQSKLDTHLIPADVLQNVKQRSVTRTELARHAATAIENALKSRSQISRQKFEDIYDALEMAAAEQLKGELTSIFVIDDGARPLMDNARELSAALNESGANIHAVLVGDDGVEPLDVGLMALEVPLNVESDIRFKGRALAKARLGEKARSRLIVREGDNKLGEFDVPDGASSIVKFDVALTGEGRRQVTFEIVGDGGDAYVGNEAMSAVINVFKNRPRIKILSDRLSREFALVRQVASELPHIEVEALLSSKVRKLEFGEEKDQLPKTLEQWKQLSALVVTGNVPPGVDAEALDTIKEALQNGLQMLVIGGASENSWTAALGIQTTETVSMSLQPRSNGWFPFYELDVDHASSLKAWRTLPDAGPASVATEGMNLLADGIINLKHVGKGGVMVCGVHHLSALRRAGVSGIVNRLIQGVLESVVQRWRLEPDGPLVLPAQPIVGHSVLSDTALGSMKGLKKTDEDGYVVEPGDAISFSVAGRTHSLTTTALRNLSDFQLAAQAAPLREVAQLGGGLFTDLVGLPQLLESMDLQPVHRSKVETWAMWEGWWPLALILLLASSEYLLRRKAGRVM